MVCNCWQRGKSMTATDRKILLLFVTVSLVLRLACLNLNSAEYTDGILQITAFDYGFTFWPPVYTVAAKAVGLLVGNLEQAAKLISIVSSTLLIVPLFWLTVRLAGRSAAIYASLFYMTNPIAARWSIRVMSDSLFALLFFWSAVLFLHILESKPGQETNDGERKPARLPWAAFVAACLMAPLATLTRYQGILLLPLEFLALKAFLARRGGMDILPMNSHGQDARGTKNKFAITLMVVLPWLLALTWLGEHYAAHERQIVERTGLSLAETLVSYWNLAESFLLFLPYFLTIPVFVLFIVGLGLFWGSAPSSGVEQMEPVVARRSNPIRRTFGWSFLAFAALILAIQSVFGAFQERYLLPLVPFMMVFVGAAAARWEKNAGKRLAVVRTALVLVICYCFAWTSAVLILQREAFGDIKQAARYCATLPPQARIFSNEFYRPDMPAIKMSFWSGRRVEGFRGSEPLAKGDYLCLHSVYGDLNEQIAEVRKRYDCKDVEWFEASIVPLLPDIMEIPGTHPNPLAWVFRYHRQRFRTVVLQIDGPRSAQ